MTPGEGRVPVRAALVLLGIWALWAPALCFQGRPSWRYSSSEVVVPKKEFYHGKSLQMPGKLSYSLRFGGQRHVIHLWRKRLLWPGKMGLMTQDDQEALQLDYPYFPEDCYFLGYLEDVPLSMVTVQTCSGGLEGVMKLDDLAYEISPLKDSNRFEHIVSQLVADLDAVGPTFGPDHQGVPSPLNPGVNLNAQPRLSSKRYSGHAAALKTIAMSSNSVYVKNNSNITQTSAFLVRVYNIVDSYLHHIQFRLYISMFVIYSVVDPVLMQGFLGGGTMLHNHYYETFFTVFNPSCAIIIIRERPGDFEYEPLPYSMCTRNSMLFVGSLDRPPMLIAVIASNVIGKTIGLFYDTPDCICQRRATCIMHKWPGITDTFSNCSFVQLQHVVSNRALNTCYFRQNWEYYNATHIEFRCGNSQVEGNQEQCDCGSLKECYFNQCCDTDCRFTTGSVCDQGKCCTNCTHSIRGTLCRTILNVCDLPEYCTGQTDLCPADVHLLDGTPCSQESYCFFGNCTDRSMHCKEIFGADAENAEEVCYNINNMNFRFGHCFRERLKQVFRPCAGPDRMCGRLQCTNVTRLPLLQNHVSFHHSLIEGAYCFGLDEHRSTGSVDVGHVRAGTPCGSGRMCINRMCNTPISSINYDCTPERCNFKGVCNNQGNCHCHIGWEPPNCDKAGFGGSLESGPPPSKLRMVGRNPELIIYLRLTYGRLYLLVVVLLIAYGSNLKTIKTVKAEEQQAA